MKRFSNRPVSRNSDAFGYNERSEVTGAIVLGCATEYAYDEIGNSTSFTANSLNQYSQFQYDSDGNLLSDGTYSFAYDSANRLKTVSSNGVLLVTNYYDIKSRRIRKVTPNATMTFFYDDWNLIEERIAYTDGTTSTIKYYWGKDLSGELQGAGGVGGLLYLTVDGVIYIPCYDNNGNVTKYIDANGNTVAQYTYDAFGKLISKSGALADLFRHRFSTKYFDTESNLYYYGYRFYHPTLMRWLNRDPIEEDGGLNLYGFCGNRSCYTIDKLGLDCCPGEKRIIGFEYHTYNRFAKTKPNFKNARKLLKNIEMIGYIQLGTSGITSILDGLIAGAGKGISSILISGSDFIIDNARQPDTDIISKIEKIYHNTTLFFPAMDGVLHYQECEKYLFIFTKWVEKQIGPSKKVEIDLLNTDREIPAKTFPEAIKAINKELLLKLKNECGSV